MFLLSLTQNMIVNASQSINVYFQRILNQHDQKKFQKFKNVKDTAPRTYMIEDLKIE